MQIYPHKKCLQDQWFWPFSLQPAELYCILIVFLCWMENSCSLSLHIVALLCQSRSIVKRMAAINVTSLKKTGGQNFLQKCLFTLRMIQVFINVLLNQVVLYPKFSWSQYKDQNISYWIQRVTLPTFMSAVAWDS